MTCEPRCRLLMLVVVTLLTSAWVAAADPIRIPLGAFSGSEQVVQFGVTSTQSLPYAEDGATFVRYTGPTSSVLSFNQFLFMSGTGVLTVAFGDQVTRAGFDFVNSLGTADVGVQLFRDPSGLLSLGQSSLGSFAPLERAFIGFTADAPFSRADISFTVPGTASFFIDDFRFDGAAPVPEPGTIGLTMLGLGWLGQRIRRKYQIGR